MFLKNPLPTVPRKIIRFWSGKMTKTKKKLLELENRIILLEKKQKNSDFSKTGDPVSEISYKEVIDEWLNGKKN